MDNEALPLVSVVVPIRNEGRFITQCLKSISLQSYPRSRVEVLVVDGESDDGTIELVESFLVKQPNMRLISNPARIVPVALNLGIQNMNGTIFLRVDGHCELDERFIEESVSLLQSSGAWCVGGAIRTLAEGSIGESIAIAQSSVFGVGGAKFRTGAQTDEPISVDTLAFGAYWRASFEKLGLFDEELVRNQDDEFNFRIKQAGGEILLSPRIKSVYHARADLKNLSRQYFQYGFWKVRVMQKRGGVASLRQLVPILLVSAIVVGAVLSIAFRAGWILALVVVPYAVCCLVGSVIETFPSKLRNAPQVAASFATMHLSYGIGFARGIKHFGMKSGRRTPTALSR